MLRELKRRNLINSNKALKIVENYFKKIDFFFKLISWKRNKNTKENFF